MSAIETQLVAIQANSELRAELLEQVRKGIKMAAQLGHSGVTIGCASIWRSHGKIAIRSSLVDIEVTRRFLWWKRERAVINGITDVLESEGYSVRLYHSRVWVMEVGW